jgi:hypothetical protein
MEIKVEVDKKSMQIFQKRINQLIAVTGKPVEEIFKQQGRLFAVSAAKYTERFGDKASTGAKHKKDVESTVRRIYKKANVAVGLIAKEMGVKAGKKFATYIRRRDVAKAQAMVDKANLSFYYKGRDVKVIQWDGGNAHSRWVKKRGTAPVRLVCEAQQINKFITKKKLGVGAAKHGWAKAAIMLGHKGSGRGMPKYFAKGGSKFGQGHRTRGYGNVTGKNHKTVLTVAHYGKYGFSRTTMDGVWRSRTKAMIKDINKKMRSAHKGKFK